MSQAMFARWCLVRCDDGREVVADLRVADRFWARFVGLQLRRSMPAHEALLLVPCGSVHTMWMRFAIDVFALGGDGRVLDVRHAVRPWHGVLMPRGTHAVLEAVPGAVPLLMGQRLRVQSLHGGDAMPRSLAFLSGAGASGDLERLYAKLRFSDG